MIRNIRWMVYVVALTLTLVPTVAAFYAMRSIVDSAVQLAFNQSISEELTKSGQRLKELAKAKPENELQYRQEFIELQDLRTAYDTLLSSGGNLQAAYMQVFFLISGLALMAALLLAWWLNRRIIRSHDSAVAQMEKAKERAIYLEQSESWRLFAQKLVHEIKNPLTPVQVMVGRIPQKYETLHSTPSPDFMSVLQETKSIVNEEITKVNNWVEAFSQYARMPAPRLKTTESKQLLESFVQQYKDYWPNLEISFSEGDTSPTLLCDSSLIKQVLFNLAKNSAEATQGKRGKFTLKLYQDLNGTSIQTTDDGPGLSIDLAAHLFQPYATGKGDRGMGLGLAIGKKILLEHGGDLVFLPTPAGCSFVLNFPSNIGASLK
jgi:nitrogen fixation/metabolism regulation signal transduction histidine kinase